MYEHEPVLYTRHHALWERRSYKTPIEKRVRNMGMMIVSLNGVDHQMLHINVPPPPKPNPDQLHDMYQFMQEHANTAQGLEGIEWMLIFANDRRMFDLEENAEQQLFYGSGDYRR